MFARMTQSFFGGTQEKESMMMSLEVTPKLVEKDSDSVNVSVNTDETGASTCSPRKQQRRSIGELSNNSGGKNVLDDLETYW